MRSLQLKLAVVSLLRADPDFSQLQVFDALNGRQMRKLLRWLDQSGIALYLLWRVQQGGQEKCLPAHLRTELERRLESNRRRTEVLFRDFRELSDSLRRRNIPHAIVKGFTLVPDFSPVRALRHQTDIDILIPPQAVSEVKPVLAECGYSIERTWPTGEISFSAPLETIPSRNDDLYRTDYHRQAEIHTSLFEESSQVRISVGQDWLSRVRRRATEGVPFVGLSEADMCMLQILHAFRHFLSSWVRLSWLWEIGYFLTSHRNDEPIWLEIRDQGGDDPILRRGAGLILSLTNRLFGSPIPKTLGNWCVDTLPDRMRCWIATFGMSWALSEFPGSKVTLFIHDEFVREPDAWRPYLWNRLFPFRKRPTLCQMDADNPAMRVRLSVRRACYAAWRIAFHARNLLSLSIEGMRWKDALASREELPRVEF